MIGAVFGSYRIVSELGSGGMGTVFLAEHTMLGSRAAIKVLKPELSQQQHVVQRFFDEARAATRVADPGIVTVLDFGWHPDGSAYLVMEHLAGETLTRRIRRLGVLAPAQALAILRQCAMAMSAAHSRGIVHRDLKPDNIFIVPDPALAIERVKVLDFGIAKLLGDGDASHGGTVTGMILGTPGYMSPEQCRGAGGVDQRTDIYALGCVGFHMLCGRPPFIADTPGDLIAAHLTQAPPAPSSLVAGVSPALDAVIARCLVKPVDARVQTMLELVGAIDAIGSSPSGTAHALALGSGAAPAALGSGVALPREAAARGTGADPAATVATGAPAAPPAATAATPTTLQSGVASIETVAPDRRSRLGGVIAIGIVAAGAVVIAIAVARGRGTRGAGGAAAAPDAATVGAPGPDPVAAVPDASPAVIRADAATRRDDRTGRDRDRDKDRIRDKDRGSGAANAGSGKAAPGTGSAARGTGTGSAARSTGAGTGSAVRPSGGSGSASGIGSGRGVVRPGAGSSAGSSSGSVDPYGIR